MDNIEIGRRIKKLRLENRMNQAELGKKCGYGSDSQSRISHYERGIRGLSATELEVFAKALGVSTQKILDTNTEDAVSDDIEIQITNLIKRLNAEQRTTLLLFLRAMQSA
jgi:transcriptional regulator with XRE-family HTH domain